MRYEIKESFGIVHVGDLHCGSPIGLLPPGAYSHGAKQCQNATQKRLWALFNEFIDWVDAVAPKNCILVSGGDEIDGVHHGSVEYRTGLINEQVNWATETLTYLAKKIKPAFISIIRGTPAHTGHMGDASERIASELKAEFGSKLLTSSDERGRLTDHSLLFKLAKGVIVDISHAASTGRGKAAMLHQLLMESWAQAGMWGHEPADVLVRHHVHSYAEFRTSSRKGYSIAMTAPGWQGKTEFVYKMHNGSLAVPCAGGSITKVGDQELHSRTLTRQIEVGCKWKDMDIVVERR